MATKQQNDFISMTEQWFAKLPPLSTNARKNIVGILPWLALIFGILGVVFSIVGLGALAVLSPFAMMAGGSHIAAGGIVGAVLALGSSVLLLASYPGLKARTSKGWKLAYWSEVVTVISAILSLSVLSVLISLFGIYLLFQVKSSYK